MAKVLEGLRVIDATTFVAAPFCCQTLADFGAEVIRIEPPGGAIDRELGPLAPLGGNLNIPLYNRNKKGITLNLRHPRGKEILHGLVKLSDVFVTNMTRRAVNSLGIGYDTLSESNHGLVYASLTGYGQTGPYAERPSFDPVCQAISGHMYVTGFKDNGPTKSASSLCDYGAGLYCVIGILLALRQREKTGKGQEIDVALLDTGISFMETVFAMYKVLGEIQPQMGNARPFSAPSDTFRCKDGYVYVAVSFNRMWERFTQVIGQEELGNDPRFASSELRRRNRDYMNNITQGWLANKTKDEAVELLTEAGIPAGPVNTVTEAFANAQVSAREMIVEIDQPDIGSIPVPGIVIKLSETPGIIETPAPSVGEHNQEIYGGLLGLSESDLELLTLEGAI
jgi:CoA:oxalate CoA-transferase